jgi:hypothetical protein
MIFHWLGKTFTVEQDVETTVETLRTQIRDRVIELTPFMKKYINEDNLSWAQKDPSRAMVNFSLSHNSYEGLSNIYGRGEQRITDIQ